MHVAAKADMGCVATTGLHNVMISRISGEKEIILTKSLISFSPEILYIVTLCKEEQVKPGFTNYQP